MSLKIHWNHLTEWALARVIRRPVRGIAAAGGMIFTLVLAIGMADYLVGIRISLAVLYLAPVALAVAWFDWRAGILVAVSSNVVRILGDYFWIGDIRLPAWSWWNSLTSLASCLVMVWVLNSFFNLNRQLEQRVLDRTMALQEAARARQQLELELLEIGSRERNLIGQELHDDVCQHLVGTALAAKVLAQRLAEEGSPNGSQAQDIVRWIEEGAAKARQLARGLLLAKILPEKLGEKLAELAAENSAAGVSCLYRQDGETLVADASTAAQLFRIAQEAVRNALRHAQPRHVDIALAGDEHAICLIVEDDGCGLAPSEKRHSGMGLRIMAHRAIQVGATLSVVAASCRGTRVICHLPRRTSLP